MLKTGYAEVDITPADPGRLGRLIAAPLQVQGIEWPLQARLTLFDDDGRRGAILSVDMNYIFAENIPEIRAALADTGCVPAADIMVACTHTHNSFSTTPWHPDDDWDFSALDYFTGFLPALIRAAEADLNPCRVRGGSVTLPGFTANRRPLYRAADGTVHVGTHGPADVPNFIGFEGPVDDEIKVLIFENDCGAPVSGLVNCAGHPTGMISQPVYSAAHIGPLLASLRKTYGCPFSFLYGLSGNLCLGGNSRGTAGTEATGELLAAGVKQAAAAAVSLRDTPWRSVSTIAELPLLRVTPEQLRHALRYRNMPAAEVDMQQMCRDLYGHDFIFYGSAAAHIRIFTDEIIGNWEFLRRLARRNPAAGVEVQTFAFGDVAIVGFGVELFCEIKHELQQQSPFSTTMFVSMANGGHGYIPNRAGFANGGYETCIGVASQFCPGAAETLRDIAASQLMSV